MQISIVKPWWHALSILLSKNRNTLCVCTIVDPIKKKIHMLRGDFWKRNQITVNFSEFVPTPVVAPNFAHVHPSNYGRTIKLGNYEAGFNGFLYFNDKNYRIKSQINRIGFNSSFGASIRRLRLWRGLSVKGCGIDPLLLAAIERNEARPNEGEVRTIANCLRVSMKDLDSY